MKKQESGRSMVEMLGVLAIIGVLSIGGIAGYTLSMRRFRVNNALDLVNKYALTTYSACQSKMLLTGISMDGCNSDPIAFSTSGLGGVPSGVKAISTPKLKAVTAANVNSNTKKASSDTVAILVTFDDVELCKTAASITGGTVVESSAVSEASTTANENACGTTALTGGGYGFNFIVYMN